MIPAGTNWSPNGILHTLSPLWMWIPTPSVDRPHQLVADSGYQATTEGLQLTK